MIRHAKKEDADSCIHLFDAISEDYSAYKNDSFYEELHQESNAGKSLSAWMMTSWKAL